MTTLDTNTTNGGTTDLSHLGPDAPATKAATLTNAKSTGTRSAADLRAAYRATTEGPAYPDAPDEPGFARPVHGATNPGIDPQAPTPGSFALAPDIGGPLMFASPDTPGMPAPSKKTAWDFLPEGWNVEIVEADGVTERRSDDGIAVFTDALGVTRKVTYPSGFTPITQLEQARLGIITPQMERVAEREPHLTSAQIRDEIAAGRMIIPANVHHLEKNLDPMCIGRASKTKVNANMGASADLVGD